jgi:hypothetical protein
MAERPSVRLVGKGGAANIQRGGGSTARLGPNSGGDNGIVEGFGEAITKGLPPEVATEAINYYYDMIEMMGMGDFMPTMDFELEIENMIKNLGSQPEKVVELMRNMAADMGSERDRQLAMAKQRQAAREFEETRLLTERQVNVAEQRESREVASQAWRERDADRTAMQRGAEGQLDVAEAIAANQQGWMGQLGQWGAQGLLVPSEPGAYYGGAQVYADLARNMDPAVVAEPSPVGQSIQVPDLAAPFAEAKQAIEDSQVQLAANPPIAAPVPPAAV